MTHVEMFRIIRTTLDDIQKRFGQLEYREKEQDEIIEYLRNRLDDIERERNVFKGMNEQLQKEYDELSRELRLYHESKGNKYRASKRPSN